MIWFIITHIFSTLVEFVGVGRLPEREKDLEILILRHQLDILERKQKTAIKLNQAEKMTLAVLTNKLKQITNRSTNQLRNTLRIFQPATVLKWHRELVRRKWTTKHKNKGGRPKIDQEMEELIVRLVNENPRWGYGKIEGELLKLGFKVYQTTIRNILSRNGIVLSPPFYNPSSPLIMFEAFLACLADSLGADSYTAVYLHKLQNQSQTANKPQSKPLS